MGGSSTGAEPATRVASPTTCCKLHLRYRAYRIPTAMSFPSHTMASSMTRSGRGWCGCRVSAAAPSCAGCPALRWLQHREHPDGSLADRVKEDRLDTSPGGIYMLVVRQS